MIKNGITILSSLKSLIAHVKQPWCFPDLSGSEPKIFNPKIFWSWNLSRRNYI